MKIKITLIAILLGLITTSCCESDTHFNDVSFVIVDKFETTSDGEVYREWTLMSHNPKNDTVVYIGTVNNEHLHSNFRIDDILWKKKNIGDVVYFEYIRKDRFHVYTETKSHNLREDTKNLKTQIKPQNRVVTEKYKEVEANPTTLTNDRNTLELERQLLNAEREVERLRLELER